jgi:hypothetical protein
MDDEEQQTDDDVDLGGLLREALYDALTPDDLALIAEIRAAMNRPGRQKRPRKPGGMKP